jgi:glycosyltransferase involved in cell wall biosynthesis
MKLEDQRVSVVMPVRNAMPFLDEAVASILAQTHRNFEFLIGDDGSTDGSTERLEQWAARDSRIRLIRSGSAGLGPSGSSNWVVRNATHQWVARMDADDVSRPDRLNRQLRAMLAHPDAVIVGSLFESIDNAGRLVFGLNRRALLNIHNDFPVAHGSILFRREAFERAGGYRPECDYWEDRDLLFRMMQQGKSIILPDAVFRYRFSSTSSRWMSDEAKVTRAVDLGLRCLAAHRLKGDYEDILEQEAQSGPAEAVALMTVVHLAYEQLWRDDKRAILRSWARRHSRIPWNRQGILARIFTHWANISPVSLRFLIKLRAKYSNWRARNIVSPQDVLTWTGTTARWEAASLNAASDGTEAKAGNEVQEPTTTVTSNLLAQLA